MTSVMLEHTDEELSPLLRILEKNLSNDQSLVSVMNFVPWGIYDEDALFLDLVPSHVVRLPGTHRSRQEAGSQLVQPAACLLWSWPGCMRRWPPAGRLSISRNQNFSFYLPRPLALEMCSVFLKSHFAHALVV